MAEKANWRMFVLEDSLIMIALLGIGITAVAVKLTPILMRWARGSH